MRVKVGLPYGCSIIGLVLGLRFAPRSIAGFARLIDAIHSLLFIFLLLHKTTWRAVSQNNISYEAIITEGYGYDYGYSYSYEFSERCTGLRFGGRARGGRERDTDDLHAIAVNNSLCYWRRFGHRSVVVKGMENIGQDPERSSMVYYSFLCH